MPGRRTQHHLWDTDTFGKGVNQAQDEEFVNLSPGEYLRGRNVRPTDMEGDAQSSKKIKGEELVHANIDNSCAINSGIPLSGDWFCVAAETVTTQKFEVWCDRNKVEAPFVRIDGKITLRSSDFPITVDAPPQLDANENCLGGLVVITDNVVKPMIFDVADMKANSGIGAGNTCTGKYFADFDVRKFTTSLELPPDHPIFIELVSTSGAGRDIGSYQYSMRFVDSDGNRTKQTAATPLIPNVAKDGTDSAQFPGTKTYGGDTAIGSPSNFGIKIRFRITNLLDHESVEIIQTAYNQGQIIGAPPVKTVIYRIEIEPQEFTVIDLIDKASPTATDSAGDARGVVVSDLLTDDETTQTLASIKSAKTPRFFKNRLHFANIKFDSRDIEGQVTYQQTSGLEMFPIMRDMGTLGHKDPYHFVYSKSYMSGERVGYAVVGYDERAELGFADRVANFDNFKYPQRRDPLTTDSSTFSYGGAAKAARSDGTVGDCHEVFDLVNAVQKTDLCLFHNVLDAGSKSRSKVNSHGCPDPGFGASVGGDEVGFEPFTPVSQNDTDVTSMNHIINVDVNDGNADRAPRPFGFGPTYYSHGMALSGLDSFPDWIKAFSVVRTETAGRVVAQGLGHYSLVSGDFNLLGNSSRMFKNLDKVWFFSPDLDVLSGIDPAIALDISANPQNYKIQLVSPLGFFTEMYNGRHRNTGRDSHIDMVQYARMLRDIPGSGARINPFEGTNMGIDGGDGNRYVAYGKYRNDNTPSRKPFDVNNNAIDPLTGDLFELTMDAFTLVNEGRGTYYEITFPTSDELYWHNTTKNSREFQDAGLQDFTEPLYIMNIVRSEQVVTNNNIQSYIETGTYQKVNAIIGEGLGVNQDQEQLLVDERWEDCIPALEAVSPLAADDRFVFVENNSGDEFAFLNVTFKNSGTRTTILNDIKNNGFFLSGTTKVFGVYTHRNDSSTTLGTDDRVFHLVFNHFDATFDPSFFRPALSTKIRVKYDKRSPIQVFGGDSFIHESIFAPIDRQGTASGDSGPGTVSQRNSGVAPNQFVMNAGFPYYKVQINNRVFIIEDTEGINKIQDINRLDMDFVRQLVTMFTCEARIGIPLMHNNNVFPGSQSDQIFYPHVNYIMRPITWNANKNTVDQNLFAGYDTAYPLEHTSGGTTQWIFGGFRFKGRNNIDYIKRMDATSIIAKPQIGFTEQNEFCVRDIWSLEVPVNVQDAPGYKTFPPFNSFDLDESQGEIKYLFDGISPKGENMYAFTEKGTCLLLHDKRILSDKNGNELAIIGTDSPSVIFDQLWISRDIGMNDEMWRSVAEYRGAIWWSNHNSAFRMVNNDIKDIGRERFHNILFLEGLKNILSGFQTQLSGFYDTYHDEYGLLILENEVTSLVLNNNFALTTADSGEVFEVDAASNIIFSLQQPDLVTDKFFICVKDNSASQITVSCTFNDTTTPCGNVVFITTIKPGECFSFTFNGLSGCAKCGYVAEKIVINEDPKCYIWSEKNQYWFDEYDYRFDQIVSYDNLIFGMRNAETYELNRGFILNGSPIVFELTASSAPTIGTSEEGRSRTFEPGFAKEYVRIRINSNVEPNKVEFRDVQNQVVQSEIVKGEFRNYAGFEQYVNRRLASADPDRKRMQGRQLIYKIIHNEESSFLVKSVGIQHKKLK